MAASAAPRGALEWMDGSETLEAESRRTRLKDTTSSMLSQYSELLRSAQVHDAVRQTVGELNTSVLATSILQATDNLIQLTDEVRRATIVGDHQEISKEVSAVASSLDTAGAHGQARLERVAEEMQAALGELEASYYCTARPAADG